MLRFARSLLGLDEPKANQTKKSIKAAQKWVLDGQGEYIKIVPSTTLIAAKKLKNDDMLLEGPSFPNEISLDGYQKKLKQVGGALQLSLWQWERLKEEIIGVDTYLPKYANTSKTTIMGKKVLSSVLEFFQHLFNRIKKDIEPADQELHDLLEKTHDEVQDLCDQLEASAHVLKDSSKSEEEKRKISVEMCNVSIEIITNLIRMISNIQTELTYCLMFEKITENIARELVLLVNLVVTKIPLPDFDFNFSDAYRNFLYNEIKGEKEEISTFETDIRGRLRRAMHEIERQKTGRNEVGLENVSHKTRSQANKSVFFQEKNHVPTPSTPLHVEEHGITYTI